MQTVPAKTIVLKNKSTAWFGCEYNMNLYRGCNHGCFYCDSRSDCYHVENFDIVRAKQNALRIVRDELARRALPGVVATGAMSDPYNPFEAKEKLTRNALCLLDAYQYGAAIATKSDLITRDIDILKDIQAHSPVLCKITITSFDDSLAKKLEPYAPPSSSRFEALRQLSAAGLFAGVLLMPVLPFIEDTPGNIEAIVRRAAACGARFVYPWFGMSMRSGQREYFLQKLEEAFPGQGLARRYANAFGTRYNCPSPRQKQLWQLFASLCEETGLLYKMQDIIAAYRQGYANRQLSFFG